ESSLELAEKNAEIQKTIYEQGQAKYDYGMISQYDLKTLENNYTTAKENVASLQKTLEGEYRSLNYLMGEKEGTEYTLIYDTAYAPYTMTQTIEQYINTRLKKDYTILQKEQNVEDAYFSSNYLPESSTKEDRLRKELNYEETKRTLKTAKQDKEQAIKDAYDSIQKLEDSYISAENALKTAQSDLTLAQLNYEMGRITELALQQAELAVEQAEDNLQQIVYAHDMQIYQFENTELL
ncbi:MAG: TolC family protein, partial [Anaerotignum sp.]